MNEDQFNADLRKFLKRFGVTAQREMERAVRDALQNGQLAGVSALMARAHLTLEGVNLDMVIEEEIHLE